MVQKKALRQQFFCCGSLLKTSVNSLLARVVFSGMILLIILLCCGIARSGRHFSLEEKTLVQMSRKYGAQARRDLLAWVELINTDNSKGDLAKLKKVNSFFNRIDFIDDIFHWHQKDYWATPIEFISSRGGDCEDFAIAKYFTLKALGVPESRLNITYVKAIKLNQAHMVLTYYKKPGAEPLIIDNLINKILPASKRRDLLPVYSFNGSGLWLAKQRGQGRKVGSSSRLSRWRSMLQRLPDELQ